MSQYHSQNPWKLPNHWEWAAVKDIGQVVSGGTPSTKSKEYWNGTINWISPADLSGFIGKYIARGAKSISQRGLDNSSAKLLPKGTLLFSSRAPVGYVAIAAEPLATNQGFKNLVPQPGLDPEYLYYYLKASKDLAEARASGTTFKELSGKAFSQLPVAIPPFTEQRRIVAKIEELFSELDNGVDSLKAARAQLKTYRQSLLKAAFEGRLTKQWRRENADQIETADQLFKCIREERNARYQKHLEHWKTAVAEWENTGKVRNRPRRPRPPDFMDDEDALTKASRSAIPSIWKWVKVGELFPVYVGATPSRNEPLYWGGSINWVSSGEVSFCDVRDTKETITADGLANTSTVTHPEGTVILAMIGEGKTRGQAAILRISAAHNQNTAAIRVSEVGLDPDYLYYYFMFRYEETRMVGSGNNQKALNKSRVKGMIFPLAPKCEQQEITTVIEQGLSSVREVKESIDVQIHKAEALRKSILKRAFEGNLVPQDSEDEPASALLERIRAQREEAPKACGRPPKANA